MRNITSRFRQGPAARPALILACAILCLAAVGCGTENVRELVTVSDFQQALASDMPVMVDFYKGGCPTCLALDPTMNELAKEYAGRAVVARFEIMKPYFVITSMELKNRYDIAMVPTVILFVKGTEKARWAVNYSAEDYRKELRKVVAAPAPGKGAR